MVEGSSAAGNNADLVDGVAVIAECGNQSVTSFVVSHPAFFVFADTTAATFRSCNHLLDGILEIALSQNCVAASSGKECRLIDRVGQVGTTEAGRDLRDSPQADFVCQPTAA